MPKQKLIIMLFILLNSPIVIIAQDSLENFKRIEIFSSNDNWGGSFIAFHDDLRTFSFGINTNIINRIELSSQYSALTNFNLIKPNTSGRIDEIILKCNYTVFTNLFKHLKFNVGIGLYSIDNYKGELIQKNIHQIWGGYRTIKYLYNEPKLNSFIFSSSLQTKKYELGSLNTTHFFLQPQLSIQHINKLYNTLRIELPLIGQSKNGHIAKFGISYTTVNFIAKHTLINAISKAESNIGVDLSLESNGILFKINSYVIEKFSTGAIGFQIPLQPRKKNNINRNVDFEIGILAQGTGYYQKIKFKHPLFLKNKFYFLINNQFGPYAKSQLLKYPQRDGNHQILTIGGLIYLFKQKSTMQVNPYYSTSLGIKNDLLYSGTKYYTSRYLISPVIVNEAGLLFKLPNKILNKYFPYGFSINYKHVTFLTSKHNVLEKEHGLNPSIFYLGAGLIIFMNW
jgi:hypothetical protein